MISTFHTGRNPKNKRLIETFVLENGESNIQEHKQKNMKVSCSFCCKYIPKSVIIESKNSNSLIIGYGNQIYDCSFCRKTRVDPIPLTEIL